MAKRQPTKRDRTGTASTEANRWANGDISNPPPHMKLTKEEKVFWQSIMLTRSTELWTPSDLEFAASLARARARINDMEAELADEGDIVINARGTQIANPKHSIIETLTRRSIALARALHIHAEATSGESRKERPANNASARTRKAKDDTDDLLPTAAH